MRNEYNRILSNLAQARKDGNSRHIKLAIRKLKRLNAERNNKRDGVVNV